MRLDNEHEIQTLVAVSQNTEPGSRPYPGDIYASLSELRLQHPDADVIFGFCVVDSRTQKIPDGFSDWHPTVQAAYQEWTRRTARTFNLSIRYENGVVHVDYNDGTDVESYPAANLAQINGIVAEAVRTALSPEEPEEPDEG